MSAALLALLLALPARAALRLEAVRAVGAEASFGVRVLRVFPSGTVPCPGAEVSLAAPKGARLEARAESNGVARFDPGQLAFSLPAAGASRLTAHARCGAERAEADLGASASELEAAQKEAAEALTAEGARLAAGGRMAEARRRFQRALELDPSSSRARFNLALSAEKLGMPRLAVSEYVGYLLLHPGAPDRAAVGRKAARLARSLRPAPPLPKEAVDFFERGRAAVASGGYAAALAAFFAAESLAPWWPEPFRAAGLVRERLALQGKAGFAVHSEAALDEFQYFLDVAPRDARARDVESRMKRLRSIASGLKAPKQIRIQ